MCLWALGSLTRRNGDCRGLIFLNCHRSGSYTELYDQYWELSMSIETIYNLLGQVSVTFATIEHSLVTLLEYLLTDDNCSLVRPYVLDTIPLARRIQMIRKVAELRLSDHSAISEQLRQVLKGITDLRIQRNLFIHGSWSTDQMTEHATSVTVLGYRPRLDRVSGVWQYLEPVTVTDSKLKAILRKAKQALQQLSAVDKRIRELELR